VTHQQQQAIEALTVRRFSSSEASIDAGGQGLSAEDALMVNKLRKAATRPGTFFRLNTINSSEFGSNPNTPKVTSRLNYPPYVTLPLHFCFSDLYSSRPVATSGMRSGLRTPPRHLANLHLVVSLTPTPIPVVSSIASSLAPAASPSPPPSPTPPSSPWHLLTMVMELLQILGPSSRPTIAIEEAPRPLHQLNPLPLPQPLLLCRHLVLDLLPLRLLGTTLPRQKSQPQGQGQGQEAEGFVTNSDEVSAILMTVLASMVDEGVAATSVIAMAMEVVVLW
jgi:hypothetical protein